MTETIWESCRKQMIVIRVTGGHCRGVYRGNRDCRERITENGRITCR